MPKLENQVAAFVGAAVLGVLGAATVYVVEHYRNKQRQHAMSQDLARLDSELNSVKKNLEELMKKANSRKSSKSKELRRNKRTAASVTSTTDEYMTSLEIDSSDLEFYDVSDEDDVDIGTEKNLQETLVEIDSKINAETDLDECLNKLQDLCIEFPQNPQLLYRIGRIHQKISDNCADIAEKQQNITKGIEACQSALSINNEIAEAHKCFAILIGSRADFQPIKERIEDGQKFREHVNKALELDPDDPVLHHMLGRFCYEVSGLKWYERKVASALFAEPPSSSYEESLGHFINAEKLMNGREFQENSLYMGKCYIALSKYKEAMDWIDKAKSEQNSNDDKIIKEVDHLIEKYGSYR